MGRWSGLSDLIDFHFEHGGGSGKSGVNVTTRYTKLDDSIFVLCRNCGHPSKKEEFKKIEANGVKLGRNPKHILTWTATAANNKLQKMSKTLANNISRLQMKMEKAVPFQQGVGKSDYCDCRNREPCCESQDLDSKNGHTTSCPDVVNVNMSKLRSPSDWNANSDSDTSDVKLINRMVQQLGQIGRYQCDSRIQSARIVGLQTKQSHPRVSHSQGSVANPDKIIQINVERYHAYSSEEIEIDRTKVISDHDFNVVKSESTDEMHNKSNKILDMRPHLEDLFYDSGVSCANTSISGSSFPSPTVNDLPVNSSVVVWNRESSSLSHNLNSSSPSVMSQKLEHDSNNSDFTSNQGVVNKKMQVHSSSNALSSPSGENVPLLTPDFNNSSYSTNSGASSVSLLESTDERSLLIEINNNESSHKRGLKNNGSKNAEICNNKNSVASKPENLRTPSNPLRLKSLKLQSYPPSKRAITIFEKEGELRQALWFQASIPRELALSILRNEQIGSFIVRESTTKPGCFALSLRVPSEYQPCGIAHFLILKSSRGYKIKGFTKEFGSLTSLITHHSILSELLPCPLSLHEHLPQVKSLRVSRTNSSDFMEPEKLFIGKYTDF